MRILLTGAAGFTGRHFKAMAMEAGHRVIALQSNLTNKSALIEELEGLEFDAVVHLAAISFVGHAAETDFYAVNVVGTTNLLSALTDLSINPTKVLLASSANVYGNCDADPVDELQLPAPVNHYAMSKLAMEHMALTYASRLPIVITRPFNYTGPGQASYFIIPKLINHFAHKAEHVELGNLHVEREFNDVRMVCAAYLSLLDYGAPGEVYNVCSGSAYSLQQVILIMEKITGHRIMVNVNPSLVRVNEVQRLRGSVEKLHACVGQLPSYSLEDTLCWMLNEASA